MFKFWLFGSAGRPQAGFCVHRIDFLDFSGPRLPSEQPAAAMVAAAAAAKAAATIAAAGCSDSNLGPDSSDAKLGPDCSDGNHGPDFSDGNLGYDLRPDFSDGNVGPDFQMATSKVRSSRRLEKVGLSFPGSCSGALIMPSTVSLCPVVNTHIVHQSLQ